MWTIYLPLVPYYILLSIKHRDFGFFARVNPSMHTGGMGLISKSAMHAMLPDNSFPSSVLVLPGQAGNIDLFAIRPPYVVKPEYGCRGRGVHFVQTREEVCSILETFKESMLVQERCTFPLEAGIFCTRKPGQRTVITGIVTKKGIIIVGDGKRTVLELLQNSPRYAVHAGYFKKTSIAKTVLTKNESLEISSIGNHARGATFYDESFRINEQLEAFIDSITCKIEGFHYGRFDIRFESWELLEQGKNWKIIELNGANSEPTHIYDPKHSYIFAIREFYRHWHIMSSIIQELNTTKSRLSLGELIQMIRKGGMP